MPNKPEDDWDDEMPPRRGGTSPGAAIPQPVIDRGSRATAGKALAKIDELSRRFDVHCTTITQRFDEHAREDREQFRKIDQKLDDQNEVLSTLRETGAATTATLGTLASELKHRREVAHLKLVADTEVQVATEKAELTDKVEKSKFKRDLVLKAVAFLGPLFAALGGAVALLVQSCK